jgi:hypothetical protein
MSLALATSTNLPGKKRNKHKFFFISLTVREESFISVSSSAQAPTMY